MFATMLREEAFTSSPKKVLFKILIYKILVSKYVVITRDEFRGYAQVSPPGLHLFIAGLILICDHAALLLLLRLCRSLLYISPSYSKIDKIFVKLYKKANYFDFHIDDLKKVEYLITIFQMNDFVNSFNKIIDKIFD